MTRPPEAVRALLREGVVAFPATPFDENDRLDEQALAEHVAELAGHRPIALAPAGGAGELFSLSLHECRRVLAITVECAGPTPVIASAGFGVATAVEMAREAERAGASAVLVFPPYLTRCEQAGLVAYVEQICAATALAVLVYSRDNGVLEPESIARLAERRANFVAVKDGVGDIEKLRAARGRVGDRLAFVNGVPTAEVIAPACFSIGVRSYSSAVFAFAPLLALRFFEALRTGDRIDAERLLKEFYEPLARLRARKAGYAVSLVKAGLRIGGRAAWRVRPPLVDFTAAEERELADLLERTRAVGAPAQAQSPT